MRAHVDVCPTCRLRYGESIATVLLLAFAAPEQEPPPHLRDRILAAAVPRAEAPLAALPEGEAEVSPVGRRSYPNWLRDRWRVAAAVLAVAWPLTVGAGLWQMRHLKGRLARLEQAAATGSSLAAVELGLSGTAAAPEATGEVFTYHDRERKGIWLSLVARRLPPLGPGQVYQLWVLYGGGQRRSGGVFVTDGSGNGSAVTWIPADLPVEGLGVTREPDALGSSPRGPRVLFARWNSPPH